jgi:hypothetical protein
MAGRGPQSFKKRQKEQQRKEKQQEKIAKRLERKRNPPGPEEELELGPFPESGLDQENEQDQEQEAPTVY